MKIIVVNLFLYLLYLNTLVNLTTAAVLELGESSCWYSGRYESDNKRCHKDVVKIKYLPNECTAYVYDGATYSEHFDIVPYHFSDDPTNLRSLLDRTNNVFLIYLRGSLDDAVIVFGDPALEAEKVKEFVDLYPVGGLILRGIERPPLNDVDIFYRNFMAYVTAIKSKNPDLKIGLYLSARDMILNKKACFDFCTINDIMDMYIIEFDTLNSCTDDLLHIGITPRESKNKDILTLNQFVDVFKQSTIAKEKVFFEFLINPKPKDEEVSNYLPCEFSYNEYCENDYQKIWCVDNPDTFYEKGLFAKDYSKGFVAKYIDLVDRDLKCECHDDKYITFNMLLNGYKGMEKITCDRLKGK